MSNKTDKELLELAAKAAEIEIPLLTDWTSYNDEDGFHWMKDGFIDSSFNPLNDDGDAFRLAVKLEIDINHYMHSVEVLAYYDGEPFDMISQDAADCRYAATRLAIVRAAAAIGERL